MTESLPVLQQRAVALIPQLVELIAQQPHTDVMGEPHPAIGLIRQQFSGDGGSRLMGALLRAYIEPLLKHDMPQDKEALIANLQDVIAGNIDVTWLRKRSDEEKLRQPKFMMLPKGTLGMHKITEEVLVRKYGRDAGVRLAAAIAPLAASDLLPNMVTVGLREFATKEIATAFERELAMMAHENNNPFADISIVEIGGGGEVARMPQTASFKYKNFTVGGRYASASDAGYVSLKNLPEGTYDYVLTNNTISLVVPRGTTADNGASAVNADLFCCCASLAKAGGKIVHTTSYDQLASPVLTDTQLHGLAGVQGAQVTLDPTSNKVWIYTKQDDRRVSDEDFRQWLESNKKSEQWDSQVAGVLRGRTAIALNLTR